MSFIPQTEKNQIEFEAVLKVDGEVQARVSGRTPEQLEEQLYKLDSAFELLTERGK